MLGSDRREPTWLELQGIGVRFGVVGVTIKGEESPTNPQQYYILQGTMEFELTNCNRFLDVSEFTLLVPKESPYVAPTRWENNVPQRNKDDSPSIEALSDVDFMTPFMLYSDTMQASDTDQLSEFELAVELDYLQEQPQNLSQFDSKSEQEHKTTVDMLDAIEQECEKQLSLGFSTVCIVEEARAGSQSGEEKHEESDPQPNNYNWLTYKENNIESLAFQGNCDYMLEDRKTKVERYLFKRMNRSWGKKISYICRKQVADARLRVKGRFITRQQANLILGMDTSDLTLDEIKSLIDSKLSLKEKELSETAQGSEDLK